MKSRKERRLDQREAVKRGNPSANEIVIAWCDPGNVSGYFTQSILSSFLYDIDEAPKRLIRSGFIRVSGGPLIARLRNMIVQHFLDTDSQWLLFVDSDMTWDKNTIHQLYSHADPIKAPIVSGFTCGLNVDGTIVSTLGIKVPDQGDELMFAFPTDVDKLVEVDTVGTGFVLIHRDVFIKVRDEIKDEHFPWFNEDVYLSRPRGEDQSFCLRARSLGIPVHVHTGIPVGHHKSIIAAPAVAGTLENK